MPWIATTRPLTDDERTMFLAEMADVAPYLEPRMVTRWEKVDRPGRRRFTRRQRKAARAAQSKR